MRISRRGGAHAPRGRWAALLGLGASLFVAVPAVSPVSSASAADSTVVVTPGAALGWVGFDDQPAGNGYASLAAGPVGAPLGVGSVQIGLTAGNAGWAFSKAAWQGTDLGRFTKLSYDTYRSSVDPGNNLAIALQLNIDYDLTDSDTSWQGRLSYEPYNLDNGGLVTQNLWQRWDAMTTGGWSSSGTPRVGGAIVPKLCTLGAPCTWSQILTAYPEAGIRVTDAAIGLKAGSGTGWNGFVGNVDNLVVGVDGESVTYDFEGGTPCTTVCYVNAATGNDLFGGDTASSAKKTIQAAINAVSSNGQVRVMPGTYDEKAPNSQLVRSPGVPYQFGLFFPAAKPGITMLGVSAADVPVTNPAATLATITTNATNSFGKSGIFVEAAGTTIQGVNIGRNIPGDDKTIEVIADDFSLLNSNTDVPAGGGSVYINEAAAATYQVTGNIFDDGTSVDIASGAGTTGSIADRIITNNTFDMKDNSYNAISFNGTGGTGWFLQPVGGATIAGNSFVNSTQFIRARGVVVDSEFSWKSWWENNTFPEGAAIALSNEAAFTPQAYVEAPFTNMRRIGGTIQGEIDKADVGNTVLVKAGTYPESVTIAKANVTLKGAGIDQTTIRGAFNSPFTLQVPAGGTGVVVDGVTVTRDTSTISKYANSTNSYGVMLYGNNATLRNSRVTGNRNGVYIENASGITVTRNVIDANRTGVHIVNDPDGLMVTNNSITGNFTLGVLFRNETAVKPAAVLTVSGNNITGNWYGDVQDKETAGGPVKNVSGNWLGTTTPVIIATDTSEPGYDDLVPPQFGGTPPASAPDVSGVRSANIDITPLLESGVDTDLVTPGFQGSLEAVSVTTAGAQAGTVSRIQEGVNLASARADVQAGTYPTATAVSITKVGFTLAGSNAGVSPNSPTDPTAPNANRVAEATVSVTGTNQGIRVGAANVTIDGLRFVDAATAGSSNETLIGAGVNFGGNAPGVRVVNNLFSATTRIAVYFNGSVRMDGGTVDDNRVVQPTRASGCGTDPVANSNCGYNLFNLWKTDSVSFQRNVVIGADGVRDRVRTLSLNFAGATSVPAAVNALVADNTIRFTCTYTCFSVAEGATNVVITGNDIVLESGNAVGFHPTWTGGNVDIFGNEFVSPNDFAVVVDNPAANVSQINVNRNSFVGGAIRNDASSFDATCNYWGSATGPAAAQIDGSAATGPFLTTADLDGGCGSITGVTGVPGNAQVSVSFVDAAPGSGNTGYRVTASPGGATCTTTTNSCVVTGLTNGTAYTFTVAATSSGSDGPASAPSAAVTPRTVPGAPTSVIATGGDTTADVNWTAPASNGGAAITGYTVTAAPGGQSCTTTGALGCTVAGLVNGTAVTFSVTATNIAGIGPASSASNSVTPAAVASQAPTVNVPDFTGVGPVRVFDTRAGQSADALRTVAKAKVGGTTVLEVQLTNLTGYVPATGVGAVSLNVAVDGPAAGGFVTAYPCGERKLVASVNYAAGQTVSNAVIVPVSATGTVCFFSSSPADLVVDLNGWFTAGEGFTAVGPQRVADTRAGQSPEAIRTVTKAKIGGASVLQVKVTDLPGFTPATGVGAVSLNVAATGTEGSGFLTVYPCGERKLVANVNYVDDQSVSNAVIAPVSAAGMICVYTSTPSDVVIDINGWLATGSDFTGVTPQRVADTRAGQSSEALRSVTKTKVGGATVLEVKVTDLPGVTPATGVDSVSLNVAATNPEAGGFITVFPCADRKLVASVNYATGQTVSNAVIAPVSATGTICFFSPVPTDIVIDINGWFAKVLTAG